MKKNEGRLLKFNMYLFGVWKLLLSNRRTDQYLNFFDGYHGIRE